LADLSWKHFTLEPPLTHCRIVADGSRKSLRCPSWFSNHIGPIGEADSLRVCQPAISGARLNLSVVPTILGGPLSAAASLAGAICSPQASVRFPISPPASVHCLGLNESTGKPEEKWVLMQVPFAQLTSCHIRLLRDRGPSNALELFNSLCAFSWDYHHI
jgi:hypothetical protein